MEQVDNFKYLGVILDNKLTFSDHVTATQRKSQQRLHVLRRLRAFNLDSKLLRLLLYRSIIESVLTYCSICYYPLLSVVNRNKLLKVSNTAAKIIGLPTPSLSQLCEAATLRKARALAADTDHPLNEHFCVLPSGRRYRCIKCRKARFGKSFVPSVSYCG